MKKEVLSVTNLRKAFDGITAVDDVSFSARESEIVGLLGPNGAGKTATINTILGVITPSAGTVKVNGMDIVRECSRILSCTNFAAAYTLLPGNLTVWQNLHIFAMLYGVKNYIERFEILLKRFDLVKFRDTRCGVLSSGEQARAGLAKAMRIIRTCFYLMSRQHH